MSLVSVLCFPRRRTPAMIGCSFVVNRVYFAEIGLLDSGMDVYGGENIELGIRVCVSPSFLLFLLPLYPCRFKWSSGHRCVAPLINEAPLRVLEDQLLFLCVQLTAGQQIEIGQIAGRLGSLLLYILRDCVLLFCRVILLRFYLLKVKGKGIKHFPNLSQCLYVTSSVLIFLPLD